MSTNVDLVKVSRATVQKIPVGWIEDLPSDEFQNSRSKLEGIEELAKSLKARQIEPLIVVSKKLPGGAKPLDGFDGNPRWTRYLLIEGFRRRAAGLSISPSFMVDCVVRDLKDVPSLQFDNFVGNLSDLRHQLPVLDICDTIVRLQRKGFDAPQIAEKTGRPIEWVQQHLLVGNVAIPEVRAAFELHRISFGIAYDLCRKPSTQLEMLEKMLSAPVVEEVKSMAQLEVTSPGITRQEAAAEAKSKGPKPKKKTKKEAARATGKVVRPGLRDIKRYCTLFDPEGSGFDARTRKNLRVQTVHLTLRWMTGEISEKKFMKELGIA